MEIEKSINAYNIILDEYNNKREIKWEDWLEVDIVFDDEEQGRHGIVGIMNFKNLEGKKCVFKLSQEINYMIRHEFSVMKSLKEVASYCPHFCKVFGVISAEVEPEYVEGANPFDIKSRYSTEKELLLCEYINAKYNLYDMIRAHKISDNTVLSSIKQVLISIMIAQNKKKFTHYDLHSMNIICKNCSPDLVFLYITGEELYFVVPSYGKYSVIIDFGFSYIEDIEDNPLWLSLEYTECGFISDRFDPINDAKLFLISVSSEMFRKRKNIDIKRFRKLIKILFEPLKVDWDCGWDNVQDKGASEYIEDFVGRNKNSKLFKNYTGECFELIQSLIILPLEEQQYDDVLKTSYKTWLKEWEKIEKVIYKPISQLCVLKAVIDVARNVRTEYLNEDTRIKSIGDFKKGVFDSLQKVGKFCNPKNINFEKMLCSLLALANGIEGLLYSIITERMAEKNEEYSRMRVKTLNEMYQVIDEVIPLVYTYNNKTEIYVVDCINNSNKTFSLTEDEISLLNSEEDYLEKQRHLFTLYKQKSE